MFPHRIARDEFSLDQFLQRASSLPHSLSCFFLPSYIEGIKQVEFVFGKMVCGLQAAFSLELLKLIVGRYCKFELWRRGKKKKQRQKDFDDGQMK